MTCNRCAKWIPLAVGGDLDPGQQLEVEEHLRSCLTCYRAYDELRRVRGELEPLRAPRYADAPDGLYDDIMVAVRRNEPGPSADYADLNPRVFEWLDSARRALPTAAAFLIFTVIGYFALGERPDAGSRGGLPRTSVTPPPMSQPISPAHMQNVSTDPLGIGREFLIPTHRMDPSFFDGAVVPPQIRRAEDVPAARRNRESGTDF